MGEKGQGDARKHREEREPERGGENLLELPESTIYGGGKGLSSGDENRRPGGAVDEIGEGEMERRATALWRWKQGKQSGL